MTRASIARRLARLAVRTGGGPLRPFWALGHAAVIRLVAARLTRGLAGARVYLKGGFGYGRAVYGLSDVDMVVVASSNDAVRVVEQRWARLARRSAVLRELFNDGTVWAYDAPGLERLAAPGESYLTFGLAGPGPDRPALIGASAPRDPMALLDHPGLYGATLEWRRLGTRRRPPEPEHGAERSTIPAWLELRFLWSLAFLACAEPGRASTAYTAQKLIADAARIRLWLEHGERHFERDACLRSARHRIPEEDDALDIALSLGGRLHRFPRPPLEIALPFLVRSSQAVTRHLSDTRGGERTAVRLLGRPDGELPLADWRARAIPGRIDVLLDPRPDDPGDPKAIAAAARDSRPDRFPVLRSGELIVLPTTEVWHRGRLRGVESPLTDPVSFALLEGAAEAIFPGQAGLSAHDCARRAVAEHRSWLALGTTAEGETLPYWAEPVEPAGAARRAGLLGAARAALWLESIERGTPELALGGAQTAELLAARNPSGEDIEDLAGLERTVTWLTPYSASGGRVG